MRWNTRFVATGGGMLLVVGLLSIPSGAQDLKGGKPKLAPPRVTEPAKVPHAPGIHVPDYFGQIEPPLTPEQRERIYEIQTRALRESETVLTPAQRTSLQEHRARSGHSTRGGEVSPGNEPIHKTPVPVRKKAG